MYLSGWHLHSLSEQPVPVPSQSRWRIFFPSIWNFQSCCSCLFSVVLSLRRVYLGLLCYCLSSRGVQQLNPLFSSPSPTWTNPAPPASPPASSAQPCNILEVLPGLSPVWQGLSRTAGPKLVTGLQMQMWVLRRGQVSFHQGLVTCLLRTAQYMVSLHYHGSALLTCVQLAVCQCLHLLILSQSVSDLQIGD